jgi:uncharacterized DUF497 family protein
MGELRFEWDETKAAAHERKHGITTFAETETVFSDEHALLLDDPDHSSTDEDQFILLGPSAGLRMLVVVHCSRAPDDTIGCLPHEGDAVRTTALHREVAPLTKEYDFSNARPNPYAKRLNRSVTIRLDTATIDYFGGKLRLRRGTQHEAPR